MKTLWLLLAALFCLGGAAAQRNWKNRKHSHDNLARAFTSDSTRRYFADDLQNERHFREHLREILIPRVPGTEGSRKVRQHIVDTMTDLGWAVEVSSSQQKTPDGVLPFHNVIATLDPEAPRRLVLACHYDSKKDPAGFLGATDSAVPCAQIINLAYSLRRDLQDDKNKRHELTLQLIFFDGEEALREWKGNDNTYGARDLANKWDNLIYQSEGVSGDHLDRIDLFVLLDLIGAKDPTFMSLQAPTENWFRRLVRIEQDLVRQGSLPQKRQPMFIDPKRQKAHGARVEDDHIHFMKKGVPILHLICVPFPSVWHKPSDDASAVDYNDVAYFNKILRVFVAEYLMLDQ